MRRSIIVAAVAPVLLASAASAAAADIEGRWTFGEGEVAITAQPDGTFAGTVTKLTSFSSCAHPVGQRMWINVTAQPDGQYFGNHQWFRPDSCDPNGAFGNITFRVLARPDGTPFLRACGSSPEHPANRPTIAPDGTSANATPEMNNGYPPCADSSFQGKIEDPTFKDVVQLPPPSRRCRSRRNFRIRLRSPAGDPLVSARVKVNGRIVTVARGARLTAPVDLRGLPKGRYTVSITAKTVLGRTVSGSRRYRTCVPRRR